MAHVPSYRKPPPAPAFEALAQVDPALKDEWVDPFPVPPRRPKKPREARGLLQRRPAESASAVTGLAGIVYGISEGNVPAAIIALGGLLPALITTLVANGGLRGCARLLWSGE